jgi:deazaflavin-dependent oxidoreductase (nitroreductase family)
MPMAGPLARLPRYLNPYVKRVAPRVPPLAVVHHRGRVSGRQYDTPVQAYPTAQGWVVGLAYNRDAAWALNLLAAGSGEMTRSGRRYQLSRPRRGGPETIELLPGYGKLMMRSARVRDYLQFDAVRED